MEQRKKVGKCDCGGIIWKYEPIGFLPETIKCDICGSGETFSKDTTEKEKIEIIKLLEKGEY